ncbi:DUF2550 family protein [Corynebacterium sp. zg254]|uniref:DUF2550 domain-containing protein n=1 Tax=Corynebacterium zhongnanshanii TaxID=2768834 RepID=A0ABQ6VFL9_9CORY|nr:MULTISPECIES: DUF2550 domain-containing protein [Corynebacterium]KAB3523217.1 DUF2550 domain-containing protein [Corynebacterium zhongnanshanii]MCR5913668.1 DUF2550 family protein [Corynebacterium sp. zg254]
MTFVVSFLVVVGICAMASAAWRFLTLRTKGFPVVVRSLPGEEGRHWRHGVVVYSPNALRVYKLRSLLPRADFHLKRLSTEIAGRRQVKDVERHILESSLHIVELQCNKKSLELALDSQADTALVAWLESRPSERRVR